MVRIVTLALLLLVACAPTAASQPTSWQIVTVGASPAAIPWLDAFYDCASQMPAVVVQRVAPSTAQIQLRVGEPAFITGAAWQLGEQELVLTLHRNLPVKNLNARDLADLLQGRITRWQSLGGPEMGVQVWLYAPESDVTQALQRYWLAGGRVTPSARWLDDTEALLARLQSEEAALGVLPAEALPSDLRAAARWSEPVLALTASTPEPAVLQLIACVQSQNR